MTPRRLLAQAADALRDGPVHTLDLARSVLGLDGPPGAISAAVFALLGPDARFHVDGEGNWSLARRDPGGPALKDESYAVVDVETTGGSYRRGHRITEIAVVQVREGIVGDAWSTLINPGRRIPPRIQSLTGITDRMVRDAPFFEDVADRVLERLADRVFVAHNVRFDWGFVAPQLGDAVGEVPEGPRLCTVKLARKLLPDLGRRNLDAVTDYYGVRVDARHRARGDAVATARILLRLLDEAEVRGLGDLTSLRRFLAGQLQESET